MMKPAEVAGLPWHGRVVARMAANLFRPFWDEPDIDLEASEDLALDPVPSLD